MLIIKAALIDDLNAADLVSPLSGGAVAIAVPLNNVFTKPGVDSRASAVVVAMERGLLPPLG